MVTVIEGSRDYAILLRRLVACRFCHGSKVSALVDGMLESRIFSFDTISSAAVVSIAG